MNQPKINEAVRLLRQALSYPNLACFRKVLKDGYYDRETIQRCYESRLEYQDEYPEPEELELCERIYMQLMGMKEMEIDVAVVRAR